MTQQSIINNQKAEIEQLKQQVDILKHKKEELEKQLQVKNNRGAGRKSRFTDEEIAQIKKDRENHLSMQEIANKYHCALGSVHNVLNS